MDPISAPVLGTEETFQEEVRENLARNYLAHVFHGIFGQTGFLLIQAPTLIPTYLYLLSGSELVVGLARAGQSLGQALSPILGATLIEHRRRVLPVALSVGGLMRVQVLGIALAGFFLGAHANVVAVCIFLGLLGFFLGMQGVSFHFLTSKVIPVEQRGTLAGLRNSLAGLSVSGVAYIAGRHLIEPNALGNGYASTFLLAFVLTGIGLLLFALVREPPSPEVRQRSRLSQRLSDVPDVLRSDRNFSVYFAARALGAMGRMAVPFYVIFAATHMDLTGERLGILTGVFVLANRILTLVWGRIADRRGFRATFSASLIVWILAVLLLMATTGFLPLVAVFAALGAGMGGFIMSAQFMVLEFGSRQDLPMRLAIATTGSELASAVGPVLGALLIGTFSYLPVFWIAIGFKLTALVLMRFGVREPRFQSS